MTDFVHQESTAWVSGTATVLPTYPAAAADGSASANDVIYLTVVAKPDTTTIAPSGSWTLVEENTGGSGAVGAGTGPTKTGIWKRSVPGGGLTSTTTVTLTGASVAMACMSQYRPGEAVTWAEQVVAASKTASADLALTAADATSIANDDHIAVVVAAPDDESTTQPVASVVASGATIGTPVVAPGSDFTATGNDLAASRYSAECTAGSSSAAPSITGTAASSETRHVVWCVIRATATTVNGVFAGTAPAAVGALTGTETQAGVLAGSAPRATGALTGTETQTGVLAGSTSNAVGALTGVVRANVLVTGAAPNARGALTGDVETDDLLGFLGGQAPRAVGSLAAGLSFAAVLAGSAPRAVGELTGVSPLAGVFAGTAPAAVGRLRGRGGLLHPRGGVPVLAAGTSAGTPVLTAGLHAGVPVLEQ